MAVAELRASPARGSRGDLRTRLGVAAVGVPLSAAVVWAGGALFAVGLGLLAAVGYWEYAAMYRGSPRPLVALGTVAAGILPVVVLYAGSSGAWILTAVFLMVAGAYGTARVPISDGPVAAAGLTVFGALYVGGLLSFGVPLREGPLAGFPGIYGDRVGATLLFFFPVVVTWLADTAAYFGGRTLGRRKLAPRVSPNKTVAGAVAALSAGPLVALAYGAVLLPGGWRLTPARAAAFGLIVALLAIVGDLVESALKRERAVKDSSRLLPGHGGLLDRLDSILWALPAAYFFFQTVG
ncbi:MAG: phosphatidate cytidylyltransferase [Gemmatimonadota bacterium]